MTPTQICQPAKELLHQLKALLVELTDEQYVQKIPLLSNASIGQHTRHVIDFFTELEKGYFSGVVNYDARERNTVIETERSFAIEKLADITALLHKPDQKLTLEAEYGIMESTAVKASTNYYRELIYNIEHTIHHMALMRIGFHLVSNIELPENFGVAGSTVRYKKKSTAVNP